MTKMIQRHKCTCQTCGQSHTVEEVVDVESLPMGIECLIVPNDDADKTWTLTIIDHTPMSNNSVGVDMVLSDMKACLWNIENVAFTLHKIGYRFVVSTPTSRFDTHSRINRLEWNDWSKNATTSKKNRMDWYSDLVAKASRGSVRSANKNNRLGVKV